MYDISLEIKLRNLQEYVKTYDCAIGNKNIYVTFAYT